MDSGPAFFRTQTASLSDTVDYPPAGYSHDQPNDSELLSYSSLKKRYHEENPFVIIYDAKKVLQNRHGDDNPEYGPLLYFFATRMNDILSPKLRSMQKDLRLWFAGRTLRVLQAMRVVLWHQCSQFRRKLRDKASRQFVFPGTKSTSGVQRARTGMSSDCVEIFA
jgi:hypothetical protein